MLKYDNKLEWQNFEKFNVKYLALRLSLFKMAKFEEDIKLKDLFKGAIISEDFLDVKVALSEKNKLYILSHRFPGIISMDVLSCDIKSQMLI